MYLVDGELAVNSTDAIDDATVVSVQTNAPAH
jgi:hypothetical protein